MFGRRFHELSDQLVHVQVAQPHGHTDDLGARFADLVDDFLDRDGWPQLNSHIAQAQIFHPPGKVFNTQIVDTFADGSYHDSPLRGELRPEPVEGLVEPLVPRIWRLFFGLLVW